MKRFVLAMVAGLVAFGVGAQIAAGQVAAGSEHAVLVELFTSEGCSDCPPADALLKKLDGHTTNAGTMIIGLSEHVTYWNRLGWADPFSEDVFTERQRVYGQRLGLEDVYTPMAVVMGGAAMNGADGGRIVRAVDEAKSAAVTLRIVSVKVVGDKLDVVFAADGALPKPGAEIVVAMADDMDTSQVLRGENGGRTLTHVAVVRSLNRVGTVKDAGEHAVTVSLPAAVSPTAAKGGHHVVVFAQEAGGGKVLAAETVKI